MIRTHAKFFFIVQACITVLLSDSPFLQAQNAHKSGDHVFTLVRIKWDAPGWARYMPFFYSSGPPWSHDWPTAEENMYTALKLLTRLQVSGEPKILTLNDDEIFDYPLLYICEIGAWAPTDKEAERLGEYLKRGGFLIIDDFRGRRELLNLIKQMNRVVPGYQYKKLDADHPIFHCFFEFNSLVYDSPYLASGYFPEYYGWFDPDGRMVAIVNYNNDIGDGWEWPKQDEIFSAEAFKLGINYIIYSLTH